MARKKKLKIKTVAWKNRFRNNGVKPVDAHKEVERIRIKNGGTTSKDDIIKEARPKRNPIHPIFEWNKDKAHLEYLRIQAETMVRSLEIVYVERENDPVRAYEIVEKKTSAKPESVTLYGSHEEAMKDPQVRERLIAEAVKTVMAWRRRYRSLNEFDQIFASIDKVVEQIVES